MQNQYMRREHVSWAQVKTATSTTANGYSASPDTIEGVFYIYTSCANVMHAMKVTVQRQLMDQLIHKLTQ